MATGTVFGHQRVTSEFQWVDGELAPENFVLLSEGYLNMSMEDRGSTRDDAVPISPAAQSLMKSPSGWRKRWCVLSQTDRGTNLLCYKHQLSSVDNVEPPVNVLLMADCIKLCTVPNHPKSPNTFAIEFPLKMVYLYPEKSSELDNWLEAFQRALGLRDDTPQSPRATELKGLPKQKAIRKDYLFQTFKPPKAKEGPKSDDVPAKASSSSTLPKRLGNSEEKVAQKNVKFLSYKTVSS